MTSLHRGPYELLRQLGEGGMGTVWLAMHRETRAHVAVKILMDRDARIKLRFRREIKILKQLQHPGIVHFIESGVEEDGELWYAMALLKGKPLSWHLKRLCARWPSPADVGQMSTLEARASTHWTDRLDDVEVMLSRARPEVNLSTSHTPRLASARSIKELRAALATTMLSSSATRSSRATSEDASPIHLDEERLLPPRPWPDPALATMIAHLAQVCLTLADVHGEGIVHCDIKPENIVITDEGDAILVDFGIAERFGARVEHDALEGAGIQAGTALYISPEQIRGEPVDARTDLYALGCILHEVLTGAPPFTQGTPMMVLLKHLSSQPESLRIQHPDVPEMLDELCMMLLAKAPEERIGHALGVARRLAPHTSLIRPWSPTPSEPKPYLYRARLTGRTTLIDALDHSLLASAAGKALGITLGGESGVGKSSIAAEIIGRARNRDFLAISARCEASYSAVAGELLAGPPLHAFEPLLRQIVDTCTEYDEATMRRMLSPHAHHLQPYSQALQEIELAPAFIARPPPRRTSPRKAQSVIFSALYELISRHIEGRPLLMLFDDLHGADELSLQALSWIVERARQDQKRWLILTFYASDELPERLNSLLAREDWIHHRIERLDDGAIMQLCAHMLGVPSLDSALIAHVQSQTQGNPFFVAEYLKLAMERGQMRMDELGRWHLDADTALHSLATPSSIQHIVDSRLSRLPEAAQRLCEVASVLGHTITIEALHALLEQPAASFMPALEMLVQREILTDELTHTYQFVHDRLRERAYTNLDDTHRAFLHRRVARWLTSQHAPPSLVATHYERGMKLKKAGKLYLRAARLAADQFAFGQSAELYERAFPLLEDPLDALEQRMTLVQDVLLPTRRLDAAEAQLEIVLKGARHHDVAALRARALTLLARTCMQQGRLMRAERLLDEAASRFDALASGQGTADTLYQLAHLKLSTVQLDDARALADEARKTYLRVEDRAGQARATLLLGEVCWRLGRFREAESTFEQALSLHQKRGSAQGEAEALVWLAQVHCAQLRFKKMGKHIVRAHQLFIDMDDPSGLAQVAILHARQALNQSDEAGAITHFRHALTNLERTHDPHHHVIALTELARVHITRGEHEIAEALITRARLLDESPLIHSTLSELDESFAEHS